MALLKKQTEGWTILKKQIDLFVKKTGLEVGVVVSYFDKVVTQRKFLVYGTECLQQSLQANVRDMVIPTQVPNNPRSIATPDSSVTDQAVPDLPDLRQTPQGCLANLSFAELRHLVPAIVKTTLERNQALWGNQEKAPVWWPSDVPYCNPCKRPKEVTGWTDQLRKAAAACYAYYGHEDFTGDNTGISGDQPAENPTITNDVTPESESTPQTAVPDEIPALQQIVNNYTTLNQDDLSILNFQSTPGAMSTALPAISLSQITINTDSSVCIDDSFQQQASLLSLPALQPYSSSSSSEPSALLFNDDTFQHQASILSQPSVQPSMSSELTDIQPPPSPESATTSSQPSRFRQCVRRSQRHPKRTLKAQEYTASRTRQRR